MILCLRTDAPLAELCLYGASGEIERYRWEAGRQLATELLLKIEQLLSRNEVSWRELSGIVVYRGPGSFTGLRIGVTVANTLSDGIEHCRLVGELGDNWIQSGLDRLGRGDDDGIIEPYYGSEAVVTQPRK